MIKCIFNLVTPEDFKQKSVLLNTYIYTMLAKPEVNDDHNIMRVFRRQGVTKDTCFLIIPINLLKEQHWSLAIIANLNNTLTSNHYCLQLRDESDKEHMPCIIYLDSLLQISQETKKALNRAANLAMMIPTWNGQKL